MAELRELLLRIKSTFDGAGFQKALDAQQKLAAKTKDIRAALNTAGLALTGFAVGAVGSITLATKATLAHAEAVDKMAKQTGIAAERLQGLGFAAEQEHASTEALAAGLVRLSRNIFDISQGAGTEAKRGLDAMGVSVLDASGNMRTADDVMLDLADAMSQNSNQTENAAVAMATLGRGGKELIPFLIQGRTEIEKQADELLKLGGVISNDTIKRYEQLGDLLHSVGRGIQALGMQFAIHFLPAIEAGTEDVKAFIKFLSSAPPWVRSTAIGLTGLAVGLAGVSGAFLLVVANIGTLQKAFDIARTSALAFGAAMKTLTAVQLGAGVAAAAAVVAIVAIEKASQKAAEAQDLLGEALVRSGALRDKNIELLRKTQVAGEKLNKLTHEEVRARRIAIEQLKAEGFAQGTSREELTKLSEALKKLLPISKKNDEAAAKLAATRGKEAEFNKRVTEAIVEQNAAKRLQEAIDQRTGVAAKNRADEMEKIRQDLTSGSLSTQAGIDATAFIEKTQAQRDALQAEENAALNAQLETQAEMQRKFDEDNMAAMDSNRKFGEKMDAEIAQGKIDAMRHASDAMEVSRDEYEQILGEMVDMTPTLADSWKEASAVISQSLTQAFAVMSDGTKAAGEKWAALGQIVMQTLQQELVAFGITNLVKGIGGTLAGNPLAVKDIFAGIAGLGGAGALAFASQAVPGPTPPLAAAAGRTVNNVYQTIEGNVTSERQLYRQATRWQDGNQRLGMAY